MYFLNRIIINFQPERGSLENSLFSMTLSLAIKLYLTLFLRGPQSVHSIIFHAYSRAGVGNKGMEVDPLPMYF